MDDISIKVIAIGYIQKTITLMLKRSYVYFEKTEFIFHFFRNG